MGNRNQLLNDNEEAMRVILDSLQSQLWTALPCIVNSVNLTEMTIEAQPTIQGSITDEKGVVTFVNMPLLVDVPICFPSAGGFILTLPIKAGDEVLVILASRCIDAWWQSGGIQKPMESRMHDLSDGFAVPGPRSLPKKVSSISSTGAQLRNDAGTTYVEISADGKIKLVSPSEIDVTGNFKVTGNVNVSGTINAVGEIMSATTPLHTHVHVSATPGTNTGPPVP